MNRERVVARIAASTPGTRRSPSDGLASMRGDHDLNPSFLPTKRPLVPAAVLVPIVDRPDGLAMMLTRRTDHLHDHAGQVSFPGGRRETGDETYEATALRESEEEVGLPSGHVTMIGRLDTYLTRTGFEIVPCVGLVQAPYPTDPDDFEVAEVFEVPLAFLMDSTNHRLDSLIYNGVERHFHAMPYNDYYIWGATAGMLINLAQVLIGADQSS